MTDPTTRRALLAGSAGVALTGVAGCLGESSGEDAAPPPEWQMYHADPQNTKVLETAGPAEGIEERWRVPFDEEERPPIRVEDALYIGGVRDGERGLFALDADSGEELWRQTEIGQVTDSPAYAGGTLYVTGEEGLHAVAPADGSIRWTWENALIATAPTLVGDRAYVGANGLHALDRESGESVASSPLGSRRIERTPAATEDVVVSATLQEVVAYDPADLELVWEQPREEPVDVAPVLADGRAYFGDGDGVCFALDLADGSVVWEQNVEAEVTASAVPHGDRVLFGTGAGAVVALGAEDGERRWSVAVDTVADALAVAGDTLFAVGGELLAVDPADGTVRWRVDPEPLYETLSVADGTLYASHDGMVQESAALTAFEAGGGD